MVDPSLIKYVKEYHDKGYSYSSLRQYLITQGYAQADVDAAITATMQPHKSSKLYLILGAVVIVIAIATLAFLLLSKPIEIQLDAIPSKQTISKGEKLDFTVSVSSNKDVDATLRYAVLRDGVIETTSFEQINTKNPTNSYSFTPKKTGSYQVEVTVQHSDGLQTSTFTFSVDANCGDNICDLTETLNSCPQDCSICGDEICSASESCPLDCDTTPEPGTDPDPDPDPVSPTNPTTPTTPTQPANQCGNGICNLDETEDSCPSDCASQQGLSGLSYLQLTRYVEEQVNAKGPESVASECATITDLNNRDECYYQIMRTALDPKYCPPIEGNIKRDDCYFTYSHNSQTYSTCDKIVDSYRRETCETLKRQQELRNQYT